MKGAPSGILIHNLVRKYYSYPIYYINFILACINVNILLPLQLSRIRIPYMYTPIISLNWPKVAYTSAKQPLNKTN